MTVDPGSRGWNEHRHRWDVPAGTIKTTDLADGSVTTPKLASGAVVKTILDVAESTDVLSATAIAVNTEIVFGTRWVPTKLDAVSLLLVVMQVAVVVVPTAAAGELSLGLWLDDGATKFRIAGGAVSGTGVAMSTSGGVRVISGVSAGAHGLQLSFVSSVAGSAYCRCASFPLIEFAKMQVLELRAP